MTKPHRVLRVAVAGQRELPEAARDGLAPSWTSRKASPRSFADYQVTAHEDRLPMGVQLLKLC